MAFFLFCFLVECDKASIFLGILPYRSGFLALSFHFHARDLACFGNVRICKSSITYDRIFKECISCHTLQLYESWPEADCIRGGAGLT